MEEITKKNNCFGCTACANICPKHAISMEYDENGFKYPKVDKDKCINCGLCKRICPANNEVKKNDNICVYAAKNKNDNIRRKSTSGGLFTAISNYVLEKKGVVYGSIMNNDFKVVYLRAESKKDIDNMRGSKYVQSDLKETFSSIKKDLEKNLMVLFVGTPCYVQGLKSYLRKEYDNLILCDIVCHGVPSPLIFDEHVNFINKMGKLKKYTFRDKEIGWRGTNVTIEYDTKKESNTVVSDIFSNLYFDGYISRICCSKCKYTSINRVSDITIGDFWEIEKSHNDFNDEKGINLVLINTLKGKKVFENIKDELEYIESSIDKCIQPQLKYPSKENKNKKQFWNDYEKKGFMYVAKKYTTYGKINSVKKRIKKLVPNKIKQIIRGDL